MSAFSARDYFVNELSNYLNYKLSNASHIIELPELTFPPLFTSAITHIFVRENKGMGTVFAQWLLTAFLSFAHPYYVSVVQIDHNTKERSLEISARVFTEDLESTLRTASGVMVDMINPKNKATNDKVLNDYFQKHLKISVNGKPVSFAYVGYERQSESIWSYFEISNVDAVKKLDVTTDLLYDFNKSQSNIIQVKANDKKDSYRLDYPKNSVSFSF